MHRSYAVLFFESILYSCAETSQLKHQVLLAVVYRIKDHTCVKVATLFHKTVQDGFDTNNRVKDVRACISFE